MSVNLNTFNKRASKSKSLKVISAAAVACLMTLSANNSANASMYVPTLGTSSAYSLDKVDAPANNTIEIPTYNSDTGLVEAINYELGIKNTNIGTENGDTSRAYSINVLPNYDVDFTAKYLTERVSQRVDISKTKTFDKDFVDLNGSVTISWGARGGSVAGTWTGTSFNDISGTFVENNVTTGSDWQAWGGALLLSGKGNSISGDFIGNYSESKVEAAGGVLCTLKKTINSISGNFISNHVNHIGSSGTLAWGGVLYAVNDSVINSFKGNFVGNYAFSELKGAEAGAIHAGYKSYIKLLEGDFLGNFANGNLDTSGGAVHIDGRVDSIKGDFIANYTKSINSISKGGAISNHYDSASILTGIGSITGNFISNYALASGNAYGGAIYNYKDIGSLDSDFYGNYAISKSADALGGAIYNEGTITNYIKGDFIGNYAISETGVAQGGAIWTDSDLNFVADNDDMIFAGNYTISNGKKDDNAIYVGSADATLNFELKNGANLILKDNIDGLTGYNVNIVGDGANTFYLHNVIRNANLSIADFKNINVIDNYAHTYQLNSLNFDGQSDIIPEVDFVQNNMDRFIANGNYTIGQGANLNVQELLWLNEPVKDLTEILFAENGLKDNVTYSGITELTTPIHNYQISYQNKEDGGYFVFARGSAFGEAKGYNPTVLSSSVNSTVGALGTMNQTFTYSFQNSDNYMNIPYAERLAYKNRNRYAISPMANGKFSPLFTHDEVGSVWVKPYATFESVNLDNGPKVSNISYGTLIGFDTGIESIGNGWDRAITGFVGYNGASQSYRGVDSIQNGGMLGGTMTLYKKNFFNATTVSVGASVANNQTMYGNEDYAMLLSGIANKAGYNYEFKEGKFIIQPSMLLSYTFVNTFDYTNAAGVRMQNDPFHSLQISPGVKFIGNFKNGWQPYLGVNMVWNIMGETNAYANGVKLPQMSVKPYVQYGVGVQKRMKDHLMAYGQAMVQNGGRNGLALTCGIRWSIGCKSCQKHQKVEGTKRHSDENQNLTMVKTKSLNGEILKQVQDDRGKYIDNKTSSLDVGGVMPRAAEHKKIIKQMTPQQRYAMGARPYNPARTATTSSTVIKQYK